MYLDNPRDRLLVLCGLALLEDLIRYSKYPSEIQYEISQAVKELQTKLTRVPSTPTRYDNYGNPHPNVEIAPEEQLHKSDCPYIGQYDPEDCFWCRSHL